MSGSTNSVNSSNVIDGVGTKGTVNRLARESEVKTLVLRGEQYTNGRKNRLKSNIRYITGHQNLSLNMR